MFFREYPGDWPRLWGSLALNFGWTDGELESLPGSRILFWLERLEELDEAVRRKAARR